jgi:hypothetical protein
MPTTLVPVFLLALTAFVVAVALMAIGVIMKRPCLRGSCGGPGLACVGCPNRRRGGEP